MPHKGSGSSSWFWFLVLPLTLSIAGASLPRQSSQDPTAPFARKGEYLGREACVQCHEFEAGEIASGVHAKVPMSPALMGCETCHGPGAAHGRDADNNTALITYPPDLSFKGQRALCGRCHRPEMQGHGGDRDGFVQAGKRCTDCHAVHEERPDSPRPGLHFFTKIAADAEAQATGSMRCLSCHPLRDQLLASSVHASLSSSQSQIGCETCHGNGSLHVQSGGLARMITRPDRARDGQQTCRSCHLDVDGKDFHWQAGDRPLLSTNLRCTSCHRVHVPHTSMPGVDPGSGEQDARREASNRLCAGCHAPAFDVLRGTIHESLGMPNGLLSQGCGACHEGAEQHAASGGHRQLVESLAGSSAETQQATCMPCHQASARHAGTGSHHRREVSCLSCHSPAAAKGALREDAHKNCQQCHSGIAAQFRQPNHHPIPEGRMFCADCHDAHSARHRFHDRELSQDRCVQCHRQYRGPFVYAHQASRRDGCVICHVPHGSSNRRMLRQVNSQQNCLQCHGDFPAFHDQTAGAVFTNCLSCHTQVHGSNHSRFLFR